ncbi:agap005082-related protein [Cystoisospora suis]|uniref:Agap005082-related protein n=1 Tax=Cystoisospora suis TaxID=483139 RepID=A0A2C6JC71_9APIC|nr:agap005082-related protein [Cystoisospora suis]
MTSSPYPIPPSIAFYQAAKNAETWSRSSYGRRALGGKSIAGDCRARTQRQPATRSNNSGSDSAPHHAPRRRKTGEALLQDACPLDVMPSSDSDRALSRKCFSPSTRKRRWFPERECFSDVLQCGRQGRNQLQCKGTRTAESPTCGPAGDPLSVEERRLCAESYMAPGHPLQPSSPAVASGNSVCTGDDVEAAAGSTVMDVGKRPPSPRHRRVEETSKSLRTQRTPGHRELTRAFVEAAARQQHGIRRPSTSTISGSAHESLSASEGRGSPRRSSRSVQRPSDLLTVDLGGLALHSLPVLVCTFGLHASFQQACGGRHIGDAVATGRMSACGGGPMQSHGKDHTTATRKSQRKTDVEPAVLEGGVEHQGLRLTLMRVGVAFLTFADGIVSLTHPRGTAASRSGLMVRPQVRAESQEMDKQPLSKSSAVGFNRYVHSTTNSEVDLRAQPPLSKFTGALQGKEGFDERLSREGDRFIKGEAGRPLTHGFRLSHTARVDWLSTATKRTVVEGFTMRLGAQLLVVQPERTELFTSARQAPGGSHPCGGHESGNEGQGSTGTSTLRNLPDEVNTSGGGRIHNYSSLVPDETASLITTDGKVLTQPPQQRRCSLVGLPSLRSSVCRSSFRANASCSSRGSLAVGDTSSVMTSPERQGRMSLLKLSHAWKQVQLKKEPESGIDRIASASRSNSDSTTGESTRRWVSRGDSLTDTLLFEDDDVSIPPERPIAEEQHYDGTDQDEPPIGTSQAKAGVTSTDGQEMKQRVALSADVDIDPVFVTLSGDDFANFSAVFALFSAFLSHLSAPSSELAQPPCASEHADNTVSVPITGEEPAWSVLTQSPIVRHTDENSAQAPRHLSTRVSRWSMRENRLSAGNPGTQAGHLRDESRSIEIFHGSRFLSTTTYRGGRFQSLPPPASTRAKTFLRNASRVRNHCDCGPWKSEGDSVTLLDATERKQDVTKPTEGGADREKSFFVSSPARKGSGGASDTETLTLSQRGRFPGLASSGRSRSREKRIMVASSLLPRRHPGSTQPVRNKLQLPGISLGLTTRRSGAASLSAEPRRRRRMRSVESGRRTSFLSAQEGKEGKSPIEKTVTDQPLECDEHADCSDHPQIQNGTMTDTQSTRFGCASSNRGSGSSTTKHCIHRSHWHRAADSYVRKERRRSGELHGLATLLPRSPGDGVLPDGTRLAAPNFTPEREFEQGHRRHENTSEQLPLCDYVWTVLAGVEGAVEMRIRAECVQVQVVSVRLSIEDLSATLLQGKDSLVFSFLHGSFDCVPHATRLPPFALSLRSRASRACAWPCQLDHTEAAFKRRQEPSLSPGGLSRVMPTWERSDPYPSCQTEQRQVGSMAFHIDELPSAPGVLLPSSRWSKRSVDLDTPATGFPAQQNGQRISRGSLQSEERSGGAYEGGQSGLIPLKLPVTNTLSACDLRHLESSPSRLASPGQPVGEGRSRSAATPSNGGTQSTGSLFTAKRLGVRVFGDSARGRHDQHLELQRQNQAEPPRMPLVLGKSKCGGAAAGDLVDRLDPRFTHAGVCAPRAFVCRLGLVVSLEVVHRSMMTEESVLEPWQWDVVLIHVSDISQLIGKVSGFAEVLPLMSGSGGTVATAEQSMSSSIARRWQLHHRFP